MDYRYTLPLNHLQEEKWRKCDIKLDKNLLKNLKAAALLFLHWLECKWIPTERTNLSSFHHRIKGRYWFITTKCVCPNPSLLSGHIMLTSLPPKTRLWRWASLQLSQLQNPPCPSTTCEYKNYHFIFHLLLWTSFSSYVHSDIVNQSKCPKNAFFSMFFWSWINISAERAQWTLASQKCISWFK